MEQMNKMKPKRKEDVTKYLKAKENFEKYVTETCGNEFELLDDYIGAKNKIKIIHHTKNNTHECIIIPDIFKKKPYCPVCSGRQIVIGYNDFNTLYPELSKYLLNYEDGYNIGKSSKEEKELLCPCCGYIFFKRIDHFVASEFNCPRCGDGYSYPNKFIFNSLLQIKDIFEVLKREYSPEWCKFKFNNKIKKGIYDIYFELHNKKYIVEMDGSFHSNDNLISGVPKEVSQYIDKEKDRLAKENNIEIIRIDCNYGNNDRYEYIKNKILNSDLNKIIQLNLIDFEKSNIESLNSYIILACELWNSGFSVGKIKNKLNLSSVTINKYLKNGAKYGICTYTKEKSITRSFGKKVYCITTNEMFNSGADGGKKYNIIPEQIYACCNNKNITAGKHPITGMGLKWIYYDDYLRMSKKEIDEYQNKTSTPQCVKIVCLNTREVFDSLKDGALWCNLKGFTAIGEQIRGKRDTAGKHPITGEPLKWMLYKDYLKTSEEKIQEILNYKKYGRKKVICLNTLEIFEDSTRASIWCGLKTKNSIYMCCRGLKKSSGRHPVTSEKLCWMYYNDYLKIINNNEEYSIKQNKNEVKVICLNNLKVFDSMADGAFWCNSRVSGIYSCCIKRYNYSGKHPETGEKLQWMYYDEYIKSKNK